MIKNLTKVGSSYALILDKSILSLMNITPDSKVQLHLEGNVLTVQKSISYENVAVEEPKVPFKKAVDSSIHRFDETYKKLADA